MSKEYYKRKLPHIQPEGATFFVTFRLFGSIPYAALQKLKQEYEIRKSRISSSKSSFEETLLNDEKQRYFTEYDRLLDTIKEGPMHLSNSRVANIVAKELYQFDGEYYDLVCFCIMSNHVHMLIDTSIQLPKEEILTSDSYIQLDQIMKNIKGRSAMKANKAIGRTGELRYLHSK
jgi:hypothetical protein